MNEEPAARSWHWLDRLTYALIVASAGCAPAELAARLEEEWLADLAARGSSLDRFRLALGCCWATRAINRELCPLAEPAAVAATPGPFAAASASWWQALPNRSVALLILVAVHGAMLYALVTAFVRQASPPPTTTQVDFVTETHPTEVLPPIVGPRLPHPPIVHRDPPVVLDRIPEPVRDPQMPPVTTEPTDPEPPPPPPPRLDRLVGGPGAGFPDSDAFYPAGARRLGEQGAVTLNVCVDATGRLTATPVVADSSGSPRLDGGAVRLASAGSGHYRPTTENGRAVASCYPFRVRFQLLSSKLGS
jgi:TonB family protein